MKKIKQLIWPLIMALYGVAILILMVTGELKSYIHPKLHILSFLAMIILFILAVATARENLNKGHIPKLKATYIVFIIPLLLFFVGTDADASRQVAVENGLKISAVPNTRQIDNNKNTTGSEINDALPTEDADSNKDTSIVADASAETKSTIDTDTPTDISSNTENAEEIDTNTDTQSDTEMNDGTLHLTDVNFTALMDDMHANLSDYRGRKISYLGLVYKQEDFEDTEIVVGRLLMYCCAADAQIMGLLGHSDRAMDYQDGDWVTIHGYIDEKAYKDPYSGYEASIPYLVIEEIEPAEEPEDPYVYFNE